MGGAGGTADLSGGAGGIADLSGAAGGTANLSGGAGDTADLLGGAGANCADPVSLLHFSTAIYTKATNRITAKIANIFFING